VLEQFARYSWPGNVRELRNILERAVIVAGEGTITTHHLPHDFGVSMGNRPNLQIVEPDAVRLPVGTTVSQAEKALIQITLQHTKNNKTRAAEILGISLKTLFNKLKEYGTAAEAEA
jgi:DNA-binding NtrC family response regulator